MSRTRIVKGKITEIVANDYNIYSESSIVDNAATIITDKGETKGESYGDPEKPPIIEGNFIIDGEWLDEDGKVIHMRKIPKARIGELVYFRVKTKDIPENTPLNFALWEHDGISIDTVLGNMLDVRMFDDSIPLIAKENGSKVIQANVDKNGYCTLSLELTSYFEQFIDDETGADIELYFIVRYWGHEIAYLPRETEKYLNVTYSDRTIFIKPAGDGYKMPELIDSIGEFIVFLKNESGDFVGNLNSDLQHFYTVKIKLISSYEYHSNFNAVTKKIYKQTYNVNTGLSQHFDLFEETEKIELTIKNNKTQVFLDNSFDKKISKPISDYYNINDIGKTGLKGIQKSLEILGYLDYWNDIQGMWNGEKPAIYDAIGVPLTTAEIVARAVGSPLKIPVAATGVLFGLAVFEATIVADAIKDMDDFVENAMMIELENAKLKGLEGIRKLFRTNDYFSKEARNYLLIQAVPQEILNEIFVGKRKKFKDIEIDQNSSKYSYTDQRYDFLFKVMPENNKKTETEYLLETIIIN